MYSNFQKYFYIFNTLIMRRCHNFRSSLVFIKKNNQIKFYFFSKKTQTEPKPVQTDLFRLGFLEQKPVQTGLARFFWFDLVFLFRFGSVRF
jgi:hypothetical protein